MRPDPDSNPRVTKPSLFKPDVEITGNREVVPTTTLYQRFFKLPTNPVIAFVKLNQYFVASLGSCWLVTFFPIIWLQVAIGLVWFMWFLFATITWLKHQELRHDLIATVFIIIMATVVAF